MSDVSDVELDPEDLSFFSEGPHNKALTRLSSLSLPEPQQYLSRAGKRKKERKEFKRAAAEEGEAGHARGAALKKSKKGREEDMDAFEDTYYNKKAAQLASSVAEEAEDAKTKRLPIKVNATVKDVKEQLDTNGIPRKDPALENLSRRQKKKLMAEKKKPKTEEQLEEEAEEKAAQEEAKRAEEERLERRDTLAELVSREDRLTHYKQTIALLCSSVLEDPEKNIGKIKELRDLCLGIPLDDRASMHAADGEEAKPVPASKRVLTGLGVTVAKLALVSLGSVFKDIIPGYRIRPLSETEESQQVSKEVKKQRAFEQTLLSQYQAFLSTLHTHITHWSHAAKRLQHVEQEDYTVLDKTLRGVAIVATRVMCLLLESASHFNYRNNIIDVVVPLMKGEEGDDFGLLCCTSVKSVFRQDESYDISLDIVKFMTREIKSANYRVPTMMLQAFQALQIKEQHIREKQRQAEREIAAKGKQKGKQQKQQGHQSRKDKKISKVEKQLEAELRETEASVSKEHLVRNQTELLKLVFTTYFRVLKNTHHSPLLPTVLEGLAQFAHLIDVSFYGDLMDNLERIMRDASLGTMVALQCVRTGSIILSGQGAALTIDPKTFHNTLYAQLLNIPGKNEETKLALTCLEHLLLYRKEVSLDRVAAFVRRLSLVSSQFEPAYALATLTLVRDILIKYPKVLPLLENDVISSGVYRPEVEDPEHANPFASTMWEMTTLRRHFHPWMQMYANNIVNGVPVSGASALPAAHSRSKAHDVLKATDVSTAFAFNPPLAAPGKHPLGNARKQLFARCKLNTKMAVFSDDELPTVPDVDFASGFSAAASARADRLRDRRDRLAHLLERWTKHHRAKSAPDMKKKKPESASGIKKVVVAAAAAAAAGGKKPSGQVVPTMARKMIMKKRSGK